MEYLIGIDLGTSGTKTVLFDREGRVAASATVEYPLYQERNGWAEQDPLDWWNAACQTLREVMAQSGVDPKDVKGLGISGQMHGLVMLDKEGKGVLVSPTIHGNLLVGPTAVDDPDREDTATTAAGIADLTEKAALSVKNVPMRQVITSFMGLRAHEAGDDFVLGETAECFFDAAGIESPGLTSAPAIGEYLAELIAEKLGLSQKAEFDPLRKGVPHLAAMNTEERAEKIRENPAYGNIICRCEEVSEGEILDAIHGILGARTLDGVKRRTRAGMGRCQAGFCSPRVMDLLSRELGLDLTEIRKNGEDSQIVLEKTRG